MSKAPAIARGTAEPARLHVPAEFDVWAICTKTKIAQEQFASAFGFTVHQVRQWEHGRHTPLGAMRADLMVIDRIHTEILTPLRQASEAARATCIRPLRKSPNVDAIAR